MTAFLRHRRPVAARLLLLLVLSLSLPPAGMAQNKPADPPDTVRLALARRLLHAMQTERVIIQGMDEAMALQRRAGGQQVPKVFMDSLMARVRRRAPEIVDSLAPVYAQTLAVGDLRDLVQFYESPLGQRFAGAQASLSTQAQQIGERWGARVALEVMQDLVNHGIMPVDSL